MATANTGTVNKEIAHSIANWITENTIYSDDNIFNQFVDAAKLQMEVAARPNTQYISSIIDGIQQGFRTAFRNGVVYAFNQQDNFSGRFLNVLSQIKENPSLATALATEDFSSLTQASLASKISVSKVGSDFIGRLKNLAKLDTEVMKKLVSGVESYMEEQLSQFNILEHNNETRETLDHEPTSEELKAEREKLSANVLEKFYDIPAVLKKLDSNDLTAQVKRDLNPSDEETRSPWLANALNIAKALKAAPFLKECITPAQIQIVANRLYAEGDHQSAEEFYKNIKHIAEFEAAFQGDFTDIIHLGKNCTIAFNTAASPEGETPEMSIFFKSERYSSLAELQEAQPNSETVMKVAWTLHRMQQQAGLQDDTTSLRTSQDQGRNTKLAAIAKQQHQNALKPAA